MTSTPCPTCGKNDFSSDSYMKKHHAMAHNESISGFPTTCTACGDTIIKSVKEHAEGRSFCNQQCMGDWRSKEMTGSDAANWSGGPVEVKCKNCGDSVKTNKANAKNRKYCSMKCAGKTNTGENNPNWRGGYEGYYGSDWNDMRDKIRLKDDNTCQACGFTTDERFLPVHHIIPVREFNEPNNAHREENLVQLCRTCHPSIEKMSVAEQVELFDLERVKNVMPET